MPLNPVNSNLNAFHWMHLGRSKRLESKAIAQTQVNWTCVTHGVNELSLHFAIGGSSPVEQREPFTGHFCLPFSARKTNFLGANNLFRVLVALERPEKSSMLLSPDEPHSLEFVPRGTFKCVILILHSTSQKLKRRAAFKSDVFSFSNKTFIGRLHCLPFVIFTFSLLPILARSLYSV